jgi:hypothetical protein
LAKAEAGTGGQDGTNSRQDRYWRSLKLQFSRWPATPVTSFADAKILMIGRTQNFQSGDLHFPLQTRTERLILAQASRGSRRPRNEVSRALCRVTFCGCAPQPATSARCRSGPDDTAAWQNYTSCKRPNRVVRLLWLASRESACWPSSRRGSHTRTLKGTEGKIPYYRAQLPIIRELQSGGSHFPTTNRGPA